MSSELSWDLPLVQYGLGAFETMRSQDGRVALWPYHRRRLEKALLRWGSPSEVMDSIENEFRSCEGKGLERVKLLLGLAADSSTVRHVYRSPLELSDRPRRLLAMQPACSVESSYKSCCYAPHFLATKKSRQLGFDDAVYVEGGQLLECGTAAIFLLSEEKGLAASGSVLDSVTKRRLMDLGQGFWTEAPILLKNAAAQGSLVIGNALQGLALVAEIRDLDGNKLYSQPSDSVDPSDWNRRIFSADA